MSNGYIDAATGTSLETKPEDMTQLRGNLLVKKTHPQIVFRGKLDSLMAEVLEVQLIAQEQGELQIIADLQEMLDWLRKIMAAEVRDEPLEELRMLGLDAGVLRYMSQDVKNAFGIEHPVPDYRMGKLCVSLNSLRTQVRETELAAIHALPGRKDIIHAMNRLSSGVYVIFCRKLSGWYERQQGGEA